LNLPDSTLLAGTPFADSGRATVEPGSLSDDLMASSSSVDPMLLDLFRAELETHLPALNEGLLALEKSGSQPERLEALMRAAHSIKGAARIVGLDKVVQVAHAMEDCFVAAQEGRIVLSGEAIDILLRGVDVLTRLGTSAEPGKLEEPTKDLVEALRGFQKTSASMQTHKSPAAPEAQTPAQPLGATTLRPAGNLEGNETKRLQTQLVDLLAKGPAEVCLDLVAVRSIDPAGLALLTLASQTGPGRTPLTKWRLVNVAPEVQTLLHLTRLDICLESSQ
jgi:two-component system sensor histidine kinase and response regulator WspE